MNKIWKFIKKKWLWLLLLAAIIIGLIIYFTRGAKPVEYITAKVEKGNLTQTVSETGAIQAATEINLNFKGNGTITEINVKEGDEVKTGDVLARLDAGIYEIQVRQAQANVSIARANLNRFLAGASPEDIKVTEEAVNNAKIAYENAKLDHEALLAKLELETTNNNNQAVINSRDNLLTSLESSLTLLDHSFDVINDIVETPSFARYFSISNQQLKNDFFPQYDYFYIDVDAAKAAFNQAKNSQSEQDIEAAFSKVTSVLEKMRKIIDLLFVGLNATVSSSDLPQSLLDIYINSVKVEQNTTNNSIATLNGVNQAYINAKNNLEVFLSTKDMQIASSQAQVDNALGAYNLAQAQLELKKAAPRQVDVAYYQAQVEQAQAALDLALANLDDYIITAPTDGKIIFVNYEVGEQIGFGITSITEAAKAVITILGKGDFEIEVDVPESDIIKIAVGNTVNITLDAYGEDVIFKGKVIFIDLAETNIQGVVYYKVLVELEKTDKEIKSGMTANVDILTAEKQGVLYAPVRAVKINEQGQQYVEILKNGQPEKVFVKTGMRGDQGIEVISGLAEGQEVVTYIKE